MIETSAHVPTKKTSQREETPQWVKKKAGEMLESRLNRLKAHKERTRPKNHRKKEEPNGSFRVQKKRRRQSRRDKRGIEVSGSSENSSDWPR